MKYDYLKIYKVRKKNDITTFGADGKMPRRWIIDPIRRRLPEYPDFSYELWANCHPLLFYKNEMLTGHFGGLPDRTMPYPPKGMLTRNQLKTWESLDLLARGQIRALATGEPPSPYADRIEFRVARSALARSKAREAGQQQPA
jgi:hypothetical protein